MDVLILDGSLFRSPAGASVNKYFLAGKLTSGVFQGQGDLDVQSVAAAKAPDGRLLTVFTLRLPQSDPPTSSDRAILCTAAH